MRPIACTCDNGVKWNIGTTNHPHKTDRAYPPYINEMVEMNTVETNRPIVLITVVCLCATFEDFTFEYHDDREDNRPDYCKTNI